MEQARLFDCAEGPACFDIGEARILYLRKNCENGGVKTLDRALFCEGLVLPISPSPSALNSAEEC
ncbi:hypothetical protein SAMN05444487_1119 [Marininema mesophilum]|uniref:Uncharacterized protein n=1 Tax=Marininema mesophilum TaxID=1048340 RepID=A0A1H2ZE41_9BACL|nr:hypothetical protein SAMN05444487_1119 [Marininema mesophilum]